MLKKYDICPRNMQSKNLMSILNGKPHFFICDVTYSVNLAGRRFESQEVTPDFIRIEEPSSAPSEQDEGETYEDYLTSRTKSFSQVLTFPAKTNYPVHP